MAIADVFDALLSKRPYKEPFTLEKTLAIIKEGRGSHFDPTVVDSFMDILDQILDIREKYKDEEESRFVEMVNQVAASDKSSLPAGE